MDNETEIIFVYNADSGLWNGYMDMLHKVVSPKTYACNLCAITYGVFSMNKEWKSFVGKLPARLTFLHRDEWIARYGRKDSLPAVFVKHNSTIKPWIDSDLLSRFDLQQLMRFIDANIGAIR